MLTVDNLSLQIIDCVREGEDEALIILDIGASGILIFYTA